MPYQNSYYPTFQAQTPIGEAFGNLTKAFLTGPSAEERAYYTARTADAQAQAQLNQQKLAGAGKIADFFRNALMQPGEQPRPSPDFAGPMPAESRVDMVRRSIPGLAEGMAGTGDVSGIGKAILTVLANAGGATDQDLTGAYVGAGHALGNDTALTTGRQDVLRNENFDQQFRRTTASAAAAADRQAKSMEGMDARSLVVVPDGAGGFKYMRKSEAAGMSAPGPGGRPTPHNYITPDGGKGVTYDGVTDAATGAKLPASTTLYGQNVAATSTGDLTKPNQTKEQAAIIANEQFKRLLDMAEPFANDPRNFGISGWARRNLQDLIQQGDAVATTVGGEIPIAQREMQQAGVKLGLGDFNEALPALQQMESLLAWSYAKAIAGQQGRGASDADYKIARDAVRADSAPEFLARIKQLRKVLASNQAVSEGALSGGTEGAKGAIAPGAPAVGTVDGGYRFKGGNPADPNSWEKVQ